MVYEKEKTGLPKNLSNGILYMAPPPEMTPLAPATGASHFLGLIPLFLQNQKSKLIGSYW